MRAKQVSLAYLSLPFQVLLFTNPRRLIGRRYEDPIVKKDIESWPFKVVDQGGNPVVEVEYLGETKTFSPQEISSMVLMKVYPPTCLLYSALQIVDLFRFDR